MTSQAKGSAPLICSWTRGDGAAVGKRRELEQSRALIDGLFQLEVKDSNPDEVVYNLRIPGGATDRHLGVVGAKPPRSSPIRSSIQQVVATDMPCGFHVDEA
jgi:hypothetical protein